MARQNYMKKTIMDGSKTSEFMKAFSKVLHYMLEHKGDRNLASGCIDMNLAGMTRSCRSNNCVFA